MTCRPVSRIGHSPHELPAIITRSNARQQSPASQSVKSQQTDYTSSAYRWQALFYRICNLFFELFVNNLDKKIKKKEAMKRSSVNY